MQRKIAEELQLDLETMAMFDKQDEEDDFNGVDQGSRDVIRGVATEIYENLKDSKFLILFLNGSDEEIDVSSMGIPPFSEFRNHAMIWAFSRGSSLTLNSRASMSKRAGKLRYTHEFYNCFSGLWEVYDHVLDCVAAAIAAGYSSTRSMDRSRTAVCMNYAYSTIFIEPPNLIGLLMLQTIGYAMKSSKGTLQRRSVPHCAVR